MTKGSSSSHASTGMSGRHAVTTATSSSGAVRDPAELTTPVMLGYELQRKVDVATGTSGNKCTVYTLILSSILDHQDYLASATRHIRRKLSSIN